MPPGLRVRTLKKVHRRGFWKASCRSPDKAGEHKQGYVQVYATLPWVQDVHYIS